jgi:hypothetical protein
MDVDTISLRTEETKARSVVVNSKDAQGKVDHRQGNIDTIAGQKITWQADADPHVSKFKVSFVNLGNAKVTWPFLEQANGNGVALPDYEGPIELTPGKSVTLTTKVDGGEKVKYMVAATPATGIDITPCDPMLIIRPTLISRVTLGLICAVTGAIAGALLALRPWQ